LSRKPSKEKAPLPGPDDPAVLLDVELDHGKLWLVLANDSDEPAFRVRVEFDAPLLGVGGELDVARLEVFGGLPLLRSGREILIYVDVALHFFARREPTDLSAHGRASASPRTSGMIWRFGGTSGRWGREGRHPSWSPVSLNLARLARFT
jgi:hypothetical protein